MSHFTRRRFLADVGNGMLVASLGSVLATELGMATAYAESSESKRLNFGKLEPLAALLQETPIEKLLPQLAGKLKEGADLKSLVAAAALANARAFGGQDYIGFHSFMALGPAYEMTRELPAERQALPVFKVLYRSSNRIQATGHGTADTLHEAEHLDLPTGKPGGDVAQAASRKGDVELADRTLATLARGEPGEAFNHLQYAVQDEVDVHRVVLSWRAWETLNLTGQEHAQTLLRQSMRYCADAEKRVISRNSPSEVRNVLPKLVDQYKLLSREAGTRRGEDRWVDELSRTIANASRDQAAEAVAAALAEGFAIEDIGEALSLAANSLLLRDPGRPTQWSSPEKPEGSVHGDSVGVHASDAASAWRNIARVSNWRNTIASLIVGAYHTAGQASRLNAELLPNSDQLAKIQATEAAALLGELKTAVEAKDQVLACSIVAKYGQLGHDARPVCDTLLGYAISEDGALHAEKYYRTACEEFARTRAAFRWRQLAALARVTASEYGRPAPGYAEAKELLKV